MGQAQQVRKIDWDPVSTFHQGPGQTPIKVRMYDCNLTLHIIECELGKRMRPCMTHWVRNSSAAAAQYTSELASAHELLDCRLVEAVDRRGPDWPYVDAEVLICGLTTQAFFKLDGRPLAGYAMTVAVDAHEGDIEAKITFEELTARVTWHPSRAL